MKRSEAVHEVGGLIGSGESVPNAIKEGVCPDSETAVRILAAAYERLLKKDPIYGHRRLSGSLAPPPGRVPPA